MVQGMHTAFARPPCGQGRLGRLWPRAVGAGTGLVLVAWLSGCASGPPASVPAATPAPHTAAPARDGGPDAPPPGLASLPDPVPQIEPIRQGGPNKPYTVLGQSYQPLQGDVSWSERGGASWYGSKFHGRRTASGELYSMYGLTAAHKTLPIPSYARVRNVRNGKEIIVRVNDRGPFHPGRVIDLSYAAAVKLDMAQHGVGDVEVSRLTFDEIRSGAWQQGTVMAATEAERADALSTFADARAQGDAVPPARAHTPTSRGFWVQLAALGRRDGIDRLQQRIAQELAALQPLVAVFNEAPWFKLQVGPYASRHEAQAAAEQARQALQLQPLVVERR